MAEKIEQRSEAWFAQRLGKITASNLNKVVATLKSGSESAERRNYRTQLVLERMTNTRLDNFQNDAMRWGTDCEPLARAAYEAATGTFVTELSFVDHPSIPMCGMSPDGYVGDDGMIEIKCPIPATHKDWLLAGVVPPEHQNQMLWQMECADRNWCDFVSFDPRFPEELQMFVVRFFRDEDRLVVLRAAVQKFLVEIDEEIAALNTLRMGCALLRSPA